MSKFLCPCGWSISDVGSPSHEKRHVISDFELDALTDYGTKSSTIDANMFRQHRRVLLECSQCGRLHLQDAPRVNHYATYAKEVDEAARVVKLEAALAQILWTYSTDPGYAEARATAERLLKRSES